MYKCMLNTVAVAALLFLVAGHAGFAQRPVAEYPMETEGESILRLYDVSGHAFHGRLVNRSKTAASLILGKGDFPNGISCISKDTTEDATVSIPNVYRGSDLTASGFTVAFWLYLDAANPQAVYRSANLVSLPALTIQLQKNGGNNPPATTKAAHLTLFYTTASQPGFQYTRYDEDLVKTGWYYMAVSYKPGISNSNNMVEFTYYYYDGIRYDPTRNGLHERTYIGRNTISRPGNNSADGELLDAKFVGRMWDLRFYAQYVPPADLNDFRNDSWNLSKRDLNYIGSIRFYPIADALSYYPCEFSGHGQELEDIISDRNSIAERGISFVRDRFDNPGRAVEFAANGYARLPIFFLPYGSSPGFDQRRGYTISFWTYIDRYLLPPDDDTKPYTDKDTANQFFYFSTSDGLAGGMASRGDKAVINRFTAFNPIQYWSLWLWDPVNFRNSKGWYHVILMQKEAAVRVILFRPGGEKACRLNYFNSQDLLALPGDEQFGLGMAPNITTKNTMRACHYLDDVRIYNWPFSDEEAQLLHLYETIHP